MRATEDRFWARVDKTESCWLWMGARDSAGYGRFRTSDRLDGAHRVAWTLLRGPIPTGMWIDHVWERGCFNRSCVNPDHLEVVTPAENTRRGTAGDWGRWFNQSKTQCPRGHAYDEENTYVSNRGARNCRACTRERMRRARAGHRQ